MIIRRYLIREVLQAFAAVFAVLLIVYVSHRFVRYLGDAAAGKIASDLLFELMALKLAANLVLLVPLSLYIAILLALGRLYRDSEVVAMTAGGVGTVQLAREILQIGLAFALLAAVLALYVSPRAAALKDVLDQRAHEESQVSGIFAGRFKDLGGGQQVVYVEDIDPGHRRMRNVFAQVRDRGRLAVLVAKDAFLTTRGPENSRFIVMENGHRYEGNPGSVDFVITRFEQHAVRIEEGSGTAGSVGVEAMPTSRLLGRAEPRYAAELQWRLSHPLSAVLLSLLAVPLARTSTRQGKYAKLFTAVLVYFVYNNLLGIAQKLVERGDLSAAVGVWPVHLGLAALTTVLLFYHSTGRWRVAAIMRRRRAVP